MPNGSVLAALNNRMAQIYHRTGSPPKRLSISVKALPELRSHSGIFVTLSATHHSGMRFCGIPLRVRDYARERTKRWHGPGAQHG